MAIHSNFDKLNRLIHSAMLSLFLASCIALEVSINKKTAVTADSLADAVSKSGVQPADVSSIAVSGGVVAQKDLTGIVTVYQNLVEFSVKSPASVEGNKLPRDSFRHSKIQKVSVNGLETVGETAFYNCTGLTEFDAKSVLQINNGAFRFCSGLTRIEFPNAVTVGNYAFMNTSLSFVDLSNAETLGANAFHFCKKLTVITLPKVKRIGTECFRETGLLTAVMPNDIEKVGSFAFWDSHDLAMEVKWDKVTVLEMGTFLNCTSITKVTAVNAKVVEPLCFKCCSKLVDVELPAVTEVGYEAFVQTPLLGQLDLMKVVSVDGWCFYQSGIKLAASDVLASVKSNAFRDCSSLSQVSFPAATSVGFQAFDNCGSISSIELPKVKSIATHGFRNCKKLASVKAPELTDVGNYSFQGCVSLSTFDAPKLTTIANFSFDGCAKLSSLSNSIGVKLVDSYAFRGCSSLEAFEHKALTYLGSYACQDCSALKKVVVGEKCTHVGFSVFWGCKALAEVTLACNADLSQCPNLLQDCPLTYLALSTMNQVTELNLKSMKSGAIVELLAADGYHPTSETYTLASYITRVGADALAGSTQVKTLNLNAKLTDIADRAFAQMSSLTSVVFGDSSTVKTMGKNVFDSATALQTITMPKTLESVGEYIFNKASALKTIYVHKSFDLNKYKQYLQQGNSATVEVLDNAEVVVAAVKESEPSQAASKSPILVGCTIGAVVILATIALVLRLRKPATAEYEDIDAEAHMEA